MTLAVALDIGGTKTSAALVTAEGEVLARAHDRTPASSGPDAVVETAIRLALQVRSGRPDASALGVGSAGVIDTAGIVTFATDSLPRWAGTDLRGRLAAGTGLPTTVLNDVHAHALGVDWLRPHGGSGTLLLVAVGTGTGGAVVVDGVVQRGAHGTAGHVGHLPSEEASGIACTCGRTGHVEAIASGPAMVAAWRRAGGGASSADTYAIAALADSDALAASIVDTAGRALGRMIGGLLNAVDPDLVVVSGGLASLGERWWAALREGVAVEAMDSVATCPVAPSSLGTDSALIGAARAALLDRERAA